MLLRYSPPSWTAPNAPSDPSFFKDSIYFLQFERMRFREELLSQSVNKVYFTQNNILRSKPTRWYSSNEIQKGEWLENTHKWNPTRIKYRENNEDTPSNVGYGRRGHFNHSKDTPAESESANRNVWLVCSFLAHIQLKKLDIAEPRARMRVVLI